MPASAGCLRGVFLPPSQSRPPSRQRLRSQPAANAWRRCNCAIHGRVDATQIERPRARKIPVLVFPATGRQPVQPRNDACQPCQPLPTHANPCLTDHTAASPCRPAPAMPEPDKSMARSSHSSSWHRGPLVVWELSTRANTAVSTARLAPASTAARCHRGGAWGDPGGDPCPVSANFCTTLNILTSPSLGNNVAAWSALLPPSPSSSPTAVPDRRSSFPERAARTPHPPAPCTATVRP